MEDYQKYFSGDAYGTDVRLFAKQLQKHKIISDTSKLDNPEIERNGSVITYRYNNISLSTKDFVININKIKHKKPNKAEISKITIDRFELIFDNDNPYEAIHCNSAYSIRGTHESKQGDLEDNMLAFHWDSDNSCLTTPMKAGSYYHPMYHVQWGGKSLWENEDENFSYGNVLILESPRISHPPMDLILLIDFIITYYINEADSKEIKRDPIYLAKSKRMQEILWKNYYSSLANHFSVRMGNPYAKFCNPQLIVPINIP